MHIHINSSISTDSFITLLVSLYFLIIVQIFCQGVSVWRLLLAGLLFTLAILTKPTALFIIPTTAAAGLLYFARRRSWQLAYLVPVFVMMVLGALLAGIFLFQTASGGRDLTSFVSSIQRVDIQQIVTQRSLSTDLHLIRWGFLSFWGLFGWANIPIPNLWSRLMWLICLSIGMGIFIFFMRQVFGVFKGVNFLRQPQRESLIIAGLAVLFSLIGVYTPVILAPNSEWVPQSRYFFPALVPFALCFYLGFQQLTPPRFHRFVLPIWIAALFVYDGLTLGLVLIPAIYG